MKKQEWLKKHLSDRERLSILIAEKKKIEKDIERCQKSYKGGKMKESLTSALDEMNVEELTEFKTELATYIKDRNSENKESAEASFKDQVKIGDSVSFLLKGERTDGTVVKINDSTFTAEIRNENGETVKRPIRFHMFLGMTAEAKTA